MFMRLPGPGPKEAHYPWFNFAILCLTRRVSRRTCFALCADAVALDSVVNKQGAK